MTTFNKQQAGTATQKKGPFDRKARKAQIAAWEAEGAAAERERLARCACGYSVMACTATRSGGGHDRRMLSVRPTGQAALEAFA